MYIAETELFMVEIYYEQLKKTQRLIMSNKEIEKLKYEPLSIKKIKINLGKEQIVKQDNSNYTQLKVQDFCDMKEY